MKRILLGLLIVFQTVIAIAGETVNIQDKKNSKKPRLPKYPENGYYISHKGDTIRGFLKNEDGLFLKYRNIYGKHKRTLRTSGVKEFNIRGQKYIPLFLSTFQASRFVAEKVAGAKYSVYFYGDNPHVYGISPAADILKVIESTDKKHNSGYYLVKNGDEYTYPVPKSNKLVNEFLNEHFQEVPEELKGKCEYLIQCFEDIVKYYN